MGEKIFHQGIVKVKFNLECTNEEIFSEEILKKKFKMDRDKEKKSLDTILEKLENTKNIDVIFPRSENGEGIKRPIIYLETKEENGIYIYQSASVNDNFYCFLLLASKDDGLSELKNILEFLKEDFYKQGYKLDFHKPKEIEGYLINERSEIILYSQELFYNESHKLKLKDKISKVFNLKQNQIILVCQIILIFITIIVWKYRIGLLGFDSNVLLTMLIPLLIGNIPSVFLMFYIDEVGGIQTKRLKIHYVVGENKNNEKAEEQVAAIENEKLTIK